MHQVQIETLLDKMGIPFDPSKKYKTKDGKDIGQPVIPDLLKVGQKIHSCC
jgi:heterodisulfide reductase subunit B